MVFRGVRVILSHFSSIGCIISSSRLFLITDVYVICVAINRKPVRFPG